MTSILDIGLRGSRKAYSQGQMSLPFAAPRKVRAIEPLGAASNAIRPSTGSVSTGAQPPERQHAVVLPARRAGAS